MKKKIFTLFFAICLIIPCIFCLPGCQQQDNNSVVSISFVDHSYQKDAEVATSKIEGVITLKVKVKEYREGTPSGLYLNSNNFVIDFRTDRESNIPNVSIQVIGIGKLVDEQILYSDNVFLNYSEHIVCVKYETISNYDDISEYIQEWDHTDIYYFGQKIN